MTRHSLRALIASAPQKEDLMNCDVLFDAQIYTADVAVDAIEFNDIRT